MKEIKEFLKQFKIVPKHISLYEEAFTHPSYNADANTKHHDYERLEFLGDAVLDLVTADMAYILRSDLDQGYLTKMRASLVNTNGLANLARNCNLHQYIRLGNSFSGDISKANHILEDVFEAFIGAVYLDQGYQTAKLMLAHMFVEPIKKYDTSSSFDYKSKLQEEMQAEHRESVTYEVISETGPAHDKRFKVAVKFDGIELGYGEGSTKKQAEQMAAKYALMKEAKK